LKECHGFVGQTNLYPTEQFMIWIFEVKQSFDFQSLGFDTL